MQDSSNRFWEIDFFRGIAIIMMIVYHLSFDLYFLANFSININSLKWVLFQRTTASIFLLLVGISLTISFYRLKDKYPKNILFLRNLRRGIKIFLWGFLITIFTLIFLKNGIIIFGILHLIGISIIVSYPFLDYKYENLVFGILIIAAGWYLSYFTFDFTYLLWLGFEPKSFFSFDYFPIMPWYGVVLLGIFFGNLFYPKGKRAFSLADLSKFFPVQILSFFGKHSLKIYLLHQPIIILLLYALGFANLSILGI